MRRIGPLQASYSCRSPHNLFAKIHRPIAEPLVPEPIMRYLLRLTH